MTKFLNKSSCYIGENVIFGKNVVLYENNHLENCQIGDNTILLPNNFISNSIVGNNCKIHNSVIEDSQIENYVNIGPFARLRPNCKVCSYVKIGNFVEIKNSFIGQGTKISHLAYVGDSEIGENCNIGCGVIFANYDGKTKHKIKVGNHVFIGSNCNLISPLNIEDDSYICAGTTVTENVEKEDFVIGRVRQQVKKNGAKKYWNREEK